MLTTSPDGSTKVCPLPWLFPESMFLPVMQVLVDHRVIILVVEGVNNSALLMDIILNNYAYA